MGHVRLILAGDLPGGVRAATDGESRVWMRTGMSQVQRRCSLAHELVHLRRRHRGCQTEAVEWSVRREVARRLIPDIHVLADELTWAHTAHEAADHLWVTTEVLRDRLGGLHPAERALLYERLGAHGVE